MPIFTFVEPSIHDYLNYAGCPYAEDTTDERYPNNAEYLDF